MWRRKWQLTPVLLPGKSMDGDAWKAAVHGVAEGQTRLSDFTLLIVKKDDFHSNLTCEKWKKCSKF